VVAAILFKELNDDLVKAANDTIYGLAAGVWTRDLSKAHSLAGKLKAGTLPSARLFAAVADINLV